MSQDVPLVCTVILNWNKPQETLTCVMAVSHQQYGNFRIIVVDNGSTDDSLSLLETSPVQIELIRNQTNLGFAGGVNVGIARALSDGADYVWLINNDAVPDTDALSRLITAMKADEKIGLASPMILNADVEDEIEFCGGLWDKNAFQTTNDPFTYLQWSQISPDKIWLVGTALMLSRSVFEAIGLFDERLFAYWEDNDYSVRSIRAGFRNVVVTSSVVRHWSGKPATEPSSKLAHYHYYMARNEILFIRKNVTFLGRFKPLLWALDKQLRKVSRLGKFPEIVAPTLGGLWDGLRGHGGAYRPERRLSPLAATFLQTMAKFCRD